MITDIFRDIRCTCGRVENFRRAEVIEADTGVEWIYQCNNCDMPRKMLVSKWEPISVVAAIKENIKRRSS
jgi:hypothetical protein